MILDDRQRELFVCGAGNVIVMLPLLEPEGLQQQALHYLLKPLGSRFDDVWGLWQNADLNVDAF